MNEQNWISFDEANDVIASLELFLECVRDMNTHPYRLKWAIISLHAATTGAIVCELSGTAGIGALSDSAAKRTLAYLNRNAGSRMPRQHLAGPKILAQRLTNSTLRIERQSDTIHIEEAWISHFEFLTEFRNQFMHFSPKGWSIGTHGLSEICEGCISVIATIRQVGWAFRHLNETELEQLDQLLRNASDMLQKTNRDVQCGD